MTSRDKAGHAHPRPYMPTVSRDGLVPMFVAAGMAGVSERSIRRAVSRGDLLVYRDPADKRRRLVDAAAACKLFAPVPETTGDAA